MPEDLKAGSAYIEVGAKADKIRTDKREIENVLKSELSRIERNVARIRPGVEATLIKKSIKEIETLHSALKKQLETKIALNADLGSIQRTQGVLRIVEDQLKGIKQEAGQSEKAVGGFFSKFGKVGSLIGFAGGAAAIAALGREAIMSAADLEVLRTNFEGTTDDLEYFRRATAGTVTDANLIKLSNQATDLGISLKQQAILFSLADDAADKYGTSVEEGFQKIIAASEGSERGLKSVGIQRQIYKSILEELARAHGEEIENLDAETQKQIRLEAILKASGVTLEDVKNKTKDTKDKLESIGVTAKDVLAKVGTMIIVTFEQIAARTESAWNMIKNKFSPGIPSTPQLNTTETDKLGQNAINNMGRGYVLPGQGFKEFAKDNKADSDVWSAKGKTVKDVEKRIENLVNGQKALVIGSIEWLNNWREIERLQNSLRPGRKDQVPSTISGLSAQDVFDMNAAGFIRRKPERPDRPEYEAPFDLKKDYESILDSLDNIVAEKENDIDVQERLNQGAEKYANIMAEAFSIANMQGKSLSQILTELFIKFADLIGQATLFAGIMSLINPSGGSFLGFFTKFLGFAGGGSATNLGGGNVNVKKFASGGSFTVPPGYLNDSFPILAQSGERVTVTPASGSNFSDRAIVSKLNELIQVTGTLVRSGSRSSGSSQIIKLYLDSKEIAREVTIRQNEFNKGNVSFNRG